MTKVNYLLTIFILSFFIVGCTNTSKIYNFNVDSLTLEQKAKYPTRLKITNGATCKIKNNKTGATLTYVFKKDQEFSGHSLSGYKNRSDFDIPDYAITFLVDESLDNTKGIDLHLLLQESGNEVFINSKFFVVYSTPSGIKVNFIFSEIDCPIEYKIIRD